jgi:heat shock protein HslJ
MHKTAAQTGLSRSGPVGITLMALLLGACQSAPQQASRGGYVRLPSHAARPAAQAVQVQAVPPPVLAGVPEAAGHSGPSPLPQRGQNPAGPVGLPQVYWQVDQIQQRAARSFRGAPWFILQADGRLEGSTGCNTLSGRYQTSGANGLQLRANASRNHCGDALAQEAALIDGFDQVRSYRIQQRQLWLLDGQGRMILRAHA